jgi:hypothetical protein
MTAHTQIPDLPENDIPGFLQIEAERGFPTDVTTLQICTSRLASSGQRYATFIGIPRAHLHRLEQVLHAARLKPLSFSLAISALQAPGASNASGVLALAVGEHHVGLQISSGGGVAALRALQMAVQTEGAEHAFHADFIAREARITLGQLSGHVRDTVKLIRIFGSGPQAAALADAFRARFESAGLKVETADFYGPRELGRELPPRTEVSPALSIAARQWDGSLAALEFLPPRVSAWRELSSKYASGNWRTAGALAAALVLILSTLFGWQQIQLTQLRSRWAAMEPKVKDLTQVQDQIQQYRPWFDESFTHLRILKAVTTAFPEDGSVTAKTLGIRELSETPGAKSISCSGNAATYSALQKTVHQLGAVNGVSDLSVPTRGKAPIQFSLDFHLAGGGAQ